MAPSLSLSPRVPQEERRPMLRQAFGPASGAGGDGGAGPSSPWPRGVLPWPPGTSWCLLAPVLLLALTGLLVGLQAGGRRAVSAISASGPAFRTGDLQATAALVTLEEAGARPDASSADDLEQEVNATEGAAEEEDEELSCKELVAHKGLVTLMSTPKSDQAFLLDLTDLLQETGKAQVLVMAMSARGVYQDDEGQAATLHEPPGDVEETLLDLRLSKDNTSVIVSRQQLTLRTSDPQMREALRLGAWGGWAGDLPLVNCQDLGETPRIIADGSDLVKNAFFMAGWQGQVSSYHLRRLRSYPDNFDVTVQMMLQDPDDKEPPWPATVIFSVVRLPEEPMAPRAADDRLGFFTVAYRDLGEHRRQVGERFRDAVDPDIFLIHRYNLKRLPGHQIRVHVDPTVPERWRRPFKEGVEGWNAAFAELGLKNVVKAILPGDSDWPADYAAGDARFTTISCAVDESEETYSIGIDQVDPRSGEILKSDIIMTTGWVRSWLDELELVLAPSKQPSSHGVRHEVGSTKRRLQGKRRTGSSRGGRQRSALARPAHAAITSITAKMSKEELEELTDAGLRSIAMHEMGHILGLRHNFKGSSGISPECIRNPKCSAIHGLSVSVMDYLPMNIPPNGIKGVHVFTPVVGAYDRLAIRYGYMEVSDSPPGNPPRRPPPELEAILQEAELLPVCADGALDREMDPLCEVDDLSSDPLWHHKERLDLIASAQRELLTVSVGSGEPYTQFGEAVLEQFAAAARIGHKLARWVGGINVSVAHRGKATGRVRRQIPEKLQQQALSTLFEILRPWKSGLLPPQESLQFLVYRPPEAEVEVRSLNLQQEARRMQRDLVNRLLTEDRLVQLEVGKVLSPPEGGKAGEAPTAGSFLAELFRSVGLEANVSGLAVSDEEEWDLQTRFVERLVALYQDRSEDMPMQVLAEVLGQMQETESALDAALKKLPKPAPRGTAAYLSHLHRMLKQARKQANSRKPEEPSDEECDPEAASCT